MTSRDIGLEAPHNTGDLVEGHRFVATVGIDRYRAWPTLSNAVSDARGALAVFQGLGFEELVPPLIDETATADAIRKLVTDDLATLGSDDSLILFVAGHGHTQRRTLHSGPVQTGFFIPVDGDPPDGRTATWLRLDTWLSDVARLPARHILVILDACHSGIVLNSLIKWRDGGATPGDSLDQLRRRQSRRVITSALGDQRAMDGGPIHGHSLFTGCLIEGLTGGLARAGRCEVTGSELGVYVQHKVTSYAGVLQTPDFGSLELDERGELVVPIASSQQSRLRSSAPSINPDPIDHSHTQPPTRTPEPNLIVLWMLKLYLFPVSWLMPNLVKSAAVWLTIRHRWTSIVGFALIAALLAPCTAGSSSSEALWIIASLLVVIAIVVGRVVPAAPTAIRWLSAALLQRRLWTGATIAGVLLGVAIGANERAARSAQRARTTPGPTVTAAPVEPPHHEGSAAGGDQPAPVAVVDPPSRATLVEHRDNGERAPRNELPAIVVDASKLWNDYEANEVAADERYKGKLIQINCVVVSVDKNFLDDIVVHLKSPNPFLNISATIQSSEAAKAAAVRKGARLTLICKGGDRIIGSPTLHDCIIKN